MSIRPVNRDPWAEFFDIFPELGGTPGYGDGIPAPPELAPGAPAPKVPLKVIAQSTGARLAVAAVAGFVIALLIRRG